MSRFNIREKFRTISNGVSSFYKEKEVKRHIKNALTSKNILMFFTTGCFIVFFPKKIYALDQILPKKDLKKYLLSFLSKEEWISFYKNGFSSPEFESYKMALKSPSVLSGLVGFTIGSALTLLLGRLENDLNLEACVKDLEESYTTQSNLSLTLYRLQKALSEVIAERDN
jgi:hypothetical protein